MICADGLTGMKEAVNAAFPQTELQRCIVHQVRNTLKYMGDKNKKEFANDLKTIYYAPSEEAALEQFERVTEKWEKDYPNAMNSWHKNWDVISPIFKFLMQVRKVIYTTNSHRKPEQRLSPSEQAGKRISKRYSIDEGTVSCDAWIAKNGLCRYVTGARCLENLKLCTPTGLTKRQPKISLFPFRYASF